LKSRLHNLEIRNFKAFRKFSLDLEGRHLLLYGPNGSGKSSLYWALYTFLQSARKTKPEVEKYFDPDEPENLLNKFEEHGSVPGEIECILSGEENDENRTYRISLTSHDTFRIPLIQEGDLASDFITYRFFFAFSNFRNSKDFNIWELFELEILPFCVTTRTGTYDPIHYWNRIKSGNPNPEKYKGWAATKRYQEFQSDADELASILPEIVDTISKEAQKFYDTHFSEGDSEKLEFKIGLTIKPAYEFEKRLFIEPVIEFGLQVGGQIIYRPQTYLNEAKLTQLALSIRFAASSVNLNQSDLKLLVLDDLLISLDMSNRMKVVEILLSDTFADYQKFILTHDDGLFREFRRMIGEDHGGWCFKRLHGNPKEMISAIEDKQGIEKAEDYIKGHDLEAAAIQLRKAIEETAISYRRFGMGESVRPGEFHSLTENLKAARNHFLEQIPVRLFKQVLNCTPQAHRSKLVSCNEDDIENDNSLSVPEKGILKTQRRRLKKFLNQNGWDQVETIEVLDAVIRMKDRVLNPAAHWNEVPLYEAEVKKALALIKRLEKCLR